MTASGVEQAIKRLHPEDGDIVLISSATPCNRQTFDAIGRWLNARGRPNILFLWMAEGTDMTSVTEADMAKLGWQPIPKTVEAQK